MEIRREIVEVLTYRGVLAYVATQALGDGCWTTANLAQSVACNTSLMLEGMQELHLAAPEVVGKQIKTQWPVGTGVPSDERVQILESDAARRQDFLDDLKRAFEWANGGQPFTMNAADGKAVVKWLKEHRDWNRADWRKMLNHRFKSEGVIKSQRLYLWLTRLEDYREAPLDRYGKVMPNGVGGKVGQAIGVEQGNRSARQQAVAAAGANA